MYPNDPVPDGAEPWVERWLAIDRSAYACDRPLVAELLDDPLDLGVLGVLADERTLAGDPHGELIALDLKLAAGVYEQGLHKHRELLRSRIAPTCDAEWGIGFVKRYTLDAVDDRDWRAPFLAIVQELVVESRRDGYMPLERIAARIPKSVRAVAVRCNCEGLEDLIAELPRLERLAIDNAIGTELAHPQLRRIEIGSVRQLADIPRTLRRLVPSRFPMVREMAIRVPQRQTSVICMALRDTGWSQQLRNLELRDADPEDVDGFGPNVEIDIVNPQATFGMPMMPAGPRFVAGDIVEHVRMTAWGEGVVTSIVDRRVTVRFADQERLFAIDTPLLRMVTMNMSGR
jgi:hypothetical protein